MRLFALGCVHIRASRTVASNGMFLYVCQQKCYDLLVFVYSRKSAARKVIITNAQLGWMIEYIPCVRLEAASSDMENERSVHTWTIDFMARMYAYTRVHANRNASRLTLSGMVHGQFSFANHEHICLNARVHTLLSLSISHMYSTVRAYSAYPMGFDRIQNDDRAFTQFLHATERMEQSTVQFVCKLFTSISIGQKDVGIICIITTFGRLPRTLRNGRRRLRLQSHANTRIITVSLLHGDLVAQRSASHGNRLVVRMQDATNLRVLSRWTTHWIQITSSFQERKFTLAKVEKTDQRNGEKLCTGHNYCPNNRGRKWVLAASNYRPCPQRSIHTQQWMFDTCKHAQTHTGQEVCETDFFSSSIRCPLCGLLAWGGRVWCVCVCLCVRVRAQCRIPIANGLLVAAGFHLEYVHYIIQFLQFKRGAMLGTYLLLGIWGI